MVLALVNRPSPRLEDCQLTFAARAPIDYQRALAQHAAYVSALRGLGVGVEVLDLNPECPDGVFIEDAAVVLDELAVIASMGCAARRREIPAAAHAVARHRLLAPITRPATIEGGDVLQAGRVLFVGATRRTNREGIGALAAIAAPFGYRVVPVPVHGGLHLKTCITALDEETFVLNRDWLDATAFKGFRLVAVAPDEPWAGNTLTVNGTTLLNAAYPNTADKIESLGFECVRVDISEFAKAEAGLTCMSLIFNDVMTTA